METHPTALPPAKSRTRLERIADALFVFLILAGLVLMLVETTVNVRVPYQLEFGEGNVLASTMRVAHGSSAYPPLTPKPPYVFSPYGPLLYWIEAPLVRWFGVGFAAGRLLSFATTLAVAVLLI